jgi:hypothetical protein
LNPNDNCTLLDITLVHIGLINKIHNQLKQIH